MRRGLLAWSPAEVPKAEFDRRLDNVRSRFADAGIDVLLVYTNFARPSAISYLTNVVLFWSEAVLVIPSTGETTLVVGLPKRDMTVIRPTGCLDTLVCDPDARTALVEVLQAQGLTDKRIGIFEAESVPAPFAAAIAGVRSGQGLIDVGDIIDALDDDGSSAALQRKAADIARNALGAASIRVADASSLVAMVELQARLSGVEEVQVLLAPDLAKDKGLRRIEDNVPLGDRFAICISLAYKGHWIRLGRSVSRTVAPSGWEEAAARLPAIAASLAPGGDIASQVASAFGENDLAKLRSWSVEGLSGGRPLALLAHDADSGGELRPSQIVVFSAWLDLPDGPFFAAATARVGEGLLVA